MTATQMAKLSWAKLKKLILKTGAHTARSNGLCIMEAAAWFAGEPHSDSPSCVDQGITSFLQYVNDNAPEDQRQELKSVVKEIIGTRTENVEIIQKRLFVAVDFAVRFAAPLALEAAKLDKEAAALRALVPVDSRAAAGAASAAAWAASAAAGAARAAAGAARAAAGAASAAAWAARAAAGAASDAAGAASAAAGAASAAAWAARAVAWAAMWKKLMPEILKTVRAMAAIK